MTAQASAPSAPAVVAAGLTRTFGDLVAVDGVSLTVPAGAIVGLIGADGAGKSTLLRMLATVLAPTAGDATVFGDSVTAHPERVTARIGYMSQRFSMYPDLTVAENLDFFGTVRGVPRGLRRERARALLAGMGLDEAAARRARNLSGGMKQKLMLAATLMHEPDLLLLDEPTTGVDPVSRREFWRILAGLHRRGRTVVVATPAMDEAERCTQVAFLEAGRLTREGTPSRIKDLVPGHLVELHGPTPRAALAALAGADGVLSVHLHGDVVRLLAVDAESTPRLVARVRHEGVEVTDCRPARIDMESAFDFLSETAGPAGEGPKAVREGTP